MSGRLRLSDLDDYGRSVRLWSLSPRFIRRTLTDGIEQLATSNERPQDADGLWLFCPYCHLARRERHTVVVWSWHVPADVSPGPERWLFSGSGVDSLYVTSSRADDYEAITARPCGGRFFVIAGRAVFASS